MPISEEEAFGPTKSAKRKKADETGFIESALAGVATGLINIPKGFVSLGAEIFDLFGDTDTATDVEKFFDDLNPFDDEAEARTVGKITQALAQIGVPAFQGAKIGMGLAKKAIDARKVGNYAQLSRFGKIINNVKRNHQRVDNNVKLNDIISNELIKMSKRGFKVERQVPIPIV